jgi:2-dehydropantoate 2-reductase
MSPPDSCDRSSLQRVCIVGAGAIGSLYAAHLGSVAEVCVLTRRAEHAQRLNAGGLRVSGKQDRHVRVRASTKPDDLGDVDLIILAAKAGDVDDCGALLVGRFHDALLMTVQNGIGIEDVVEKHGHWPIISAVTFMAGMRHSDTQVELELDMPTWLGPWAGGGAAFSDAQRVAALLQNSGLAAEAFEDVRPAQWSKLIFNAAVNSTSAVTGLCVGPTFMARDETTDLGHLVYAMIEEGKTVAAGCGITLHMDPWDMCMQAITKASSAAADAREPSMLSDIRARRPTEIDWITGAIVRAAADRGVPAPIHDSLYRLVKAHEMSWSAPPSSA